MSVAGDSALQSGVLEDLSEAVNYRRWLAGLALPYLGEDPLEVGSGIGDYAAEWAARGLSVTASEADPGRLQVLRARFAGDPLVRVRELTVPLTGSADHSAVVAYNVLEHIPEHVDAVRGFARLVRPGGAVVLLVPAFPSAMSRFDRAIGHQRRYRKGSLADVLREAGLDVEVLRYLNSAGLLAWYVGMRALRMTPRSGPVLRAWDAGAVPVLRRVERRWAPPFGQSLFTVGRVSAGGPGAPRGSVSATAAQTAISA